MHLCRLVWGLHACGRWVHVLVSDGTVDMCINTCQHVYVFVCRKMIMYNCVHLCVYVYVLVCLCIRVGIQWVCVYRHLNQGIIVKLVRTYVNNLPGCRMQPYRSRYKYLCLKCHHCSRLCHTLKHTMHTGLKQCTKDNKFSA